jgi:replication factor C small subunit
VGNVVAMLTPIPRWTEKYRPTTLDEVVQQKETISFLQASLKNQNLKNLLLSGPAGSGKTTVALALGKECFGEAWKDRVKKFIGSDLMSFEKVVEDVRLFAKQVKSRIVIIDDADLMPPRAQLILPLVMQQFYETRFIIVCANESKICKFIQSRCATVRFRAIEPEFMKNRIEQICKHESLEFEPMVVHKLVALSEGNMKRAITMLQNLSTRKAKVTETHVRETSCSDLELKGQDLYHALRRANSSKETFEIATNFVKSDGDSLLDSLAQMLDLILLEPSIEDAAKAKCTEFYRVVEVSIIKNADAELQLFDLFSKIRPLIKDTNEVGS